MFWKLCKLIAGREIEIANAIQYIKDKWKKRYQLPNTAVTIRLYCFKNIWLLLVLCLFIVFKQAFLSCRICKFLTYFQRSIFFSSSKCLEIFHLNENLHINIQWVLLTRIDVLIYPSGRHFGESRTVMLTGGLVQKVHISLSIKLSCCSEAQYPLSPPNVDAKYYIWILFYKLILFFIPFTMLKRLSLLIAGGLD